METWLSPGKGQRAGTSPANRPPRVLARVLAPLLAHPPVCSSTRPLPGPRAGIPGQSPVRSCSRFPSPLRLSWGCFLPLQDRLRHLDWETRRSFSGPVWVLRWLLVRRRSALWPGEDGQEQEAAPCAEAGWGLLGCRGGPGGRRRHSSQASEEEADQAILWGSREQGRVVTHREGAPGLRTHHSTRSQMVAPD